MTQGVRSQAIRACQRLRLDAEGKLFYHAKKSNNKREIPDQLRSHLLFPCCLCRLAVSMSLATRSLFRTKISVSRSPGVTNGARFISGTVPRPMAVAAPTPNNEGTIPLSKEPLVKEFRIYRWVSVIRRPLTPPDGELTLGFFSRLPLPLFLIVC